MGLINNRIRSRWDKFIHRYRKWRRFVITSWLLDDSECVMQPYRLSRVHYFFKHPQDCAIIICKYNHSDPYHNVREWLTTFSVIKNKNNRKCSKNCALPQEGWPNVPWSEICIILPTPTGYCIPRVLTKMILDQQNANQAPKSTCRLNRTMAR